MNRLIILSLLFFAVNSAVAECVQTPCWVQEMKILSRHSPAEFQAEIRDHSRLPREDALRLLADSTDIVLKVEILRSFSIPICGDGKSERWKYTPRPTDLLLVDSTWAENGPGDVIQGYVSTPCCDTLPIETATCTLELNTLKSIPKFYVEIGEVPEWAEIPEP